MLEHINPAEFDQEGTIVRVSKTKTAQGQSVPSAANLYTNVKTKQLAPPRGSENFEGDQPTAQQRNSWLIRKENRTISPATDKFVVDSTDHWIEAVRPYKGSRNLLVLDTITKDRP